MKVKNLTHVYVVVGEDENIKGTGKRRGIYDSLSKAKNLISSRLGKTAYILEYELSEPRKITLDE